MKILTVAYKFFRGIFRFIFLVTACFTCKIIAMIGGEEDIKEITVRKAKRIRRLTRFKIWVYNNLPYLMKFFGQYNYLENLYKRLNYGL